MAAVAAALIVFFLEFTAAPPANIGHRLHRAVVKRRQAILLTQPNHQNV